LVAENPEENKRKARFRMNSIQCCHLLDVKEVVPTNRPTKKSLQQQQQPSLNAKLFGLAMDPQ